MSAPSPHTSTTARGADAVTLAMQGAHARAMAAVWTAGADLHGADQAVFAARDQLEPGWRAGGIPVDAQQRLIDASLAAAGLTADPADLDPGRLIFRIASLSVHPLLPRPVRVLLLLRMVAGADIERLSGVFNVDAETMTHRLRIVLNRAHQCRHEADDLSSAGLVERVASGLSTLQVVFDEGYVGADALNRRPDNLCAVAIGLAREALGVLPQERDIRASLAAMLLQDSRRQSRIRDDGALEPMWSQDRDLWDRAMIDEGAFLVRQLGRGGEPSAWVLRARIQYEYAVAPTYADVNWDRLVSLHNELVSRWPDPITAVSRVTAIAEADGPQAALASLDQVPLDDPMVVSARAELLHRLGRSEESDALMRDLPPRTDNGSTAPIWTIGRHL